MSNDELWNPGPTWTNFFAEAMSDDEEDDEESE